MMKMIEAVLKRDSESIVKALQFGENPNARNAFGLSASDYARLLGYEEALGKMAARPQHQIHVITPQGLRLSVDEASFSSFFKIDYLPYPRFSSPKTLEKTLNNFPYLLRLKALSEEERNNFSRFEKELNQGLVAPSTIQWIDDKVGYGLFTERPLIEGAWIGEYTGIVRRYYRTRPDKNGYCLKYPTKLFSLFYTMVDAQEGGNETRFINHSETPNVRPLICIQGRLFRFGLVASRPIEPGEQLTLDYGPDYWRQREMLL